MVFHKRHHDISVATSAMYLADGWLKEDDGSALKSAFRMIALADFTVVGASAGFSRHADSV